MTLSLPTGSARLTLIAAAAWITQPFTSGLLLGEALSNADDPYRTTVSILAWTAWLFILLAIAIPRPVTLTVARLGTTGGVAATLWATVDIAADETDVASAIIAVGLVASIASEGSESSAAASS